MDKKILDVLKNFHSNGLFVSPNIPRKKVENAHTSYGMSKSIKVLGIVDSTVFGSAKNGLAFTAEGLFWKNDWTITSAKSQMSWDEFKSTAQARSVKGSDLLLGNGCVFGMSGSQMKAKVLLQLMEKLAQKIQENTKPTEGDDSATAVQPAASQLQVERDDTAASQAQVEPDDTAASNNTPEAVAPKPSQEPAFEGSYQPEYLFAANFVAEQHRLSPQVQIAPAIKVYKVKKIIEISGGMIKPYDILVVADNTFLQTSKDFLVVTAQAIWAKGILRKLEHFPIKEIRSIRCERKNLYINDYDFQLFDQFSENEVLVMTNMLRDLVEMLGEI